MSDLTGKVALVTGGSRGIGAAIVRHLAAAGADVAMTYQHNELQAKSVVAEAEALAEAEWRERDPILRLERLGLAEGWYAEDELREIAAAAAAAVEEAVRFGRESGFPPPGLVAETVYADG